MRLGIDIGTVSSTIAAYSEGPLIYGGGDRPQPFISVIPHQPALQGLSLEGHLVNHQSGTSLPAGRSSLGPAWDCLQSELMWSAYLKHLQNYLPPHANEPIESVTVSIPNCLGLKERQILSRALQHTFPETSSYLLPQPLAAFIGYRALNPETLLEGDVLLVDCFAGTAQFSFLSTVRPAQMVLETELPLAEESSLNFFIDTIVKPHAQKLGLFDQHSWRLDNILLLNSDSGTSGLLRNIEDLFPGVPVYQGETEHPYHAVGDCLWQEAADQISFIYPFKFYLEKQTGQGGSVLELIPFDTVNLELTLGERYILTSLAVRSDYNLATAPEEVEIRLYASQNRAGRAEMEEWSAPDLVMHWHQQGWGGDELLNIELDVSTSQIFINFTTDPVSRVDTEILVDWPSRQLSLAKYLSAYKNVDQELIKTLITHLTNQLESSPGNSADACFGQLQASYYRLLCALQIMNP